MYMIMANTHQPKPNPSNSSIKQINWHGEKNKKKRIRNFVTNYIHSIGIQLIKMRKPNNLMT